MRFRLPVTDEARPPGERVAASSRGAEFPSPPHDIERINILLVDDEPKNLTVLESVLSDPEYRLVRAESAEQALLALVVEEFALLVLDIQMPGMNGFELAQMVKQRKKTAGIPIIFLTAFYSADEHVLEGYGTGAVDYLHKPINPAVLRSKVAVFVQLHRKTRELEAANRALLSEVNARRRVQEELQLLTNELEKRVAERTAELAQAEAALKEASRRKDEFLATLAHELRNPLAPIRNAVEILRFHDAEAKELDWARDVIDRQSKLMTRLVDDLLDVARITTGKLAIHREMVDIQTIVARAAETSRPFIDDSGIQLTIHLPPEPIVVCGDMTRLAQAISNLLNNAAKFTERGGSINLSVESTATDVLLSVADTGIGIAPNMLASVFEMFAQGANEPERSQSGLGIGLTLVKRLVELHGGSIEAHSEGPGKGSVFLVHLPLADGAQKAESSNDHPDRAKASSRLRILIADDNQDNANAMRIMLRLMGHEVDMAYDGQSAVERAELTHPDAILLDIGMPKLDGYAACRQIRSQPWGHDMLIIAQTGWGQDEDRKRTLDAGFDHHLVKPIDSGQLSRLLNERAAALNQPR